jgi:hypothetical protein
MIEPLLKYLAYIMSISFLALMIYSGIRVYLDIKHIKINNNSKREHSTGKQKFR